jgi:hypothetical protein
MRQLVVQEDLASELSLLERVCPTCGASCVAEEPDVASRRRAEGLGWEDLRQYWYHLFKEKVFFSYYRCQQCELLYCPKYFDEEMLTKLYGGTQHEMLGVPLGALRRTQRGYFRTLQRHSPLRGNILEIGPDVGLFAEFCVREGHFDRFIMFEPSRAAHGELKKRLAGKKYEIHTDMFAPEVIPERSISVAVIVHVMDHLIDPKSAMEALLPRLADNAVVLVVTHDESSLMAKVFRTKWPPYCLVHPQLYNPRSMRTFLEGTGYKVLEISKTYNHFPVMYLFKHFLAAVGLRRLWVPKLGWLQLPLKLGNIITIAAPRR